MSSFNIAYFFRWFWVMVVKVLRETAVYFSDNNIENDRHEKFILSEYQKAAGSGDSHQHHRVMELQQTGSLRTDTSKRELGVFRWVVGWQEYIIFVKNDIYFAGVMRFYYQHLDGTCDQKVSTKCVRVHSSDTTAQVVERLVEKFRCSQYQTW